MMQTVYKVLELLMIFLKNILSFCKQSVCTDQWSYKTAYTPR